MGQGERWCLDRQHQGRGPWMDGERENPLLGGAKRELSDSPRKRENLG